MLQKKGIPIDPLNQLRTLVSELESSDENSDNYKDTLQKIESLIKEEITLIEKLKRSDNKVKHYENICTGILTIISSTNI
jgi:hypothetical protein